eukprot:TRINITY_DN33443_c0_g1_i1.p1 TRINITY_DN33443_c0_g1~~TRINITY_DN33443_c0_g1_i1.p1  ORF type:complete len:534 (+),score=70.08 TRINITY_DN33443_c0_g1_i1:70-1671(+)
MEESHTAQPGTQAPAAVESLLTHQEAPLKPTLNPFSNPATVTPYEIAKGLVVGVSLFPLRLALLLVVAVAEVLVSSLATIGTSQVIDKGCYRHLFAFPKWRRFLLYPIWPLNRMFLVVFGFWPGCIRVTDHRKNKQQPSHLLAVAPHTSFLDSFMVAWAFPPAPGGVAHSGVLNIPVFRNMAISAQSVFVDRKNPESKASCKKAILERASPEWTGTPFMIFPEGVITNGTTLIRFNLGAFVPGHAVTIVTLRYRCRFFNLRGCGKNHNLPIALMRAALQFANFCDIDILETYVPSESEVTDPQVFAQNVRSVVAKHIGVPTTEHSYDEADLAFKSKAHVGLEFDMRSLQSEYSCSSLDIRAVHRLFEDYDKACNGAISFAVFETTLRAAVSPGNQKSRSPASIQHLFTFFDHNGSGLIEFLDFVEAAALLSGRKSVATRTKFAFLLADLIGDGLVSRALLEGATSSTQLTAEELVASGGIGDVEVVDFAVFKQLMQRRPDVLEGLLDTFREHLGFPRFGLQQSRGDEGGKKSK